MNLDFQRVLCAHAARYPLMEPQDFGKLAYQSEFGPEHLVSSPELVRARLLEEWQALPPDAPREVPEPIGNGLFRFHLAGQSPEPEAANLLAELFCRTAQERTGTREGLSARLDCLQKEEIPGMASWLAEYGARGFPPVSHSQTFRDAYRPHYRLLSAPYACYFPVLLAVQKLVQDKRPALVAIDGRCGSGKTGLAALLRQVFSCSVFHMDDFYLPAPQRLPDWESRPAGNMDLGRFLREVLLPARAGKTVEYRAFDCHSGCLREAVPVRPAPLAVVEGSYSQHPVLAPYYDLKVFLTCSKAEQGRRLLAREGPYFSVFQARWIPLEEHYFRIYEVERNASLRTDTTGFFQA